MQFSINLKTIINKEIGILVEFGMEGRSEQTTLANLLKYTIAWLTDV